MHSSAAAMRPVGTDVTCVAYGESYLRALRTQIRLLAERLRHLLDALAQRLGHTEDALVFVGSRTALRPLTSATRAAAASHLVVQEVRAERLALLRHAVRSHVVPRLPAHTVVGREVGHAGQRAV